MVVSRGVVKVFLLVLMTQLRLYSSRLVNLNYPIKPQHPCAHYVFNELSYLLAVG